MGTRTNPPRSDQHPAAQVATGRVLLWTANWSIGRRAGLFLFGLLMQFAHSVFFRMLLVPGYEWLDTMEPRLYLLGEALATATNLGLLALPFFKTPGLRMRAVLMAAFALGAFANAAWMIRGLFLGAFSYYFTCDPQWGPCDEDILFSMFVDDVWSYAIYCFALYLNLSFLWRIGKHEKRAAVG